MKKIVVVGGGAIGLQVVGRLTQGGLPALLLGRTAGVQALRESALTIRFPEEERSIRVQAISSLDELTPEQRHPDLAILCVKSYDTAAAIDTLRALEPHAILSLQNGIGNEERLAEHFGRSRVIAGAITTSVELPNPTTVVITKAGGIGLAGLDPTIDLTPWLGAFAAAGFPVRHYSDYRALKWSKALLNMLGNAQAAILDMPIPVIYANPRLVDIDLNAVREALAVMAAMNCGVVNLPGYPAATLAAIARFTPNPLLRPLMRRLVSRGRGGKEPSLLRDLRAGRTRSEGEQLYGAVAAAAAAYATPAPINTALWRILGGIVRGEIPWEQYRGQPAQLLAALG